MHFACVEDLLKDIGHCPTGQELLKNLNAAVCKEEQASQGGQFPSSERETFAGKTVKMNKVE